jgi:hypothetical protein
MDSMAIKQRFLFDFIAANLPIEGSNLIHEQFDPLPASKFEGGLNITMHQNTESFLSSAKSL